MDAVLYEKLLDELRADLAVTAPKLDELQSVESFLQSRLEIVADKTSYQNVLDDITSDINSHNHTLAELERIDRFVSGQLGKPGYTPPVGSPTPKPSPADIVMETSTVKNPPAGNKPPVENKPPAVKTPPVENKPPAVKTPPPVKPTPPEPAKVTDEDTKDEPQKSPLQTMPGSAGGNTIEFGPDGFPVHGGGGMGKAPSEQNANSAAAEGATINFGPDGFPVDMPKPGAKKK